MASFLPSWGIRWSFPQRGKHYCERRRSLATGLPSNVMQGLHTFHLWFQDFVRISGFHVWFQDFVSYFRISPAISGFHLEFQNFTCDLGILLEILNHVDHDRGCLSKKVCVTLRISAYIYNSSCKLCKFLSKSWLPRPFPPIAPNTLSTLFTTFYIPQAPKGTIFKSFISSLHARTSVWQVYVSHVLLIASLCPSP